MPGGDSVTGTIVAAREAFVPTEGMAPEKKWPEDELELQPKDQQLEDEMEKRLEEKEEPWTNSTAWNLLPATADHLVPAEDSRNTSLKTPSQAQSCRALSTA
jgi:hypothetical protein